MVPCSKVRHKIAPNAGPRNSSLRLTETGSAGYAERRSRVAEGVKAEYSTESWNIQRPMSLVGVGCPGVRLSATQSTPIDKCMALDIVWRRGPGPLTARPRGSNATCLCNSCLGNPSDTQNITLPLGRLETLTIYAKAIWGRGNNLSSVP